MRFPLQRKANICGKLKPMDFSNADITQCVVHGVGNKVREEALKLSKKAVVMDEQLDKYLKRFFLNPFREEQQIHRFFHEMGLDLNEVFQAAQKCFDAGDFLEQSQHIATHLFHQTRNPAIKAGDLFVAYVEGVEYQDEPVHALGIFKSESKQVYLGVDGWEIGLYEGIALNKLDKGCLILDLEEEEGYTCFLYEAGGQVSDYWGNDFLRLKAEDDTYGKTYEFLNQCKQFFTTDLVQEEQIDRASQINLVNDTVKYFQLKDSFQLDEFKEEVLIEEPTKERFDQFLTEKNWEEPQFEIAANAVKKHKRKFKSVLKLDKNFHIYIHGNRDLIEYGVDPESGKKFYKVFFDEEH